MRTGPLWQYLTGMVGTEVTQELYGVCLFFSEKMTKWKLKQWMERKKDSNNNNKILHNTVVWLRRLRELGFQNATNCGYPRATNLWSDTLWAHVESGGVEMFSCLLWNYTREDQKNKWNVIFYYRYLYQLGHYTSFFSAVWGMFSFLQ